jgi:uncharacterized protein (TIGR01777 family)
MKIVVAGSSGLIGSALVSSLRSAGHEVLRLVRSRHSGDRDSLLWDPNQEQLDAAAVEGTDAVVNLAGEPLIGRWTLDKKNRIRASRIHGTRLLCQTLMGLSRKPQIVISASAVGYYGDRGDELLEESSPPGSGFLASVCREWEETADAARKGGIRVVHPRFGIVLSASGGALAQSLLPFWMGLGGVLGGGRQYWSWIALDDVVAILQRFLEDPSFDGPVNVTSPQPATNRQFTEALARALGRPARLAVPAFALRLALGPMADEVLLASARVVPAKLLAAGYAFKHASLDDALAWCLSERQTVAPVVQKRQTAT